MPMRNPLNCLTDDNAAVAMHLARPLLLNSNKPVGEVARLCGFAHEAYFSRRLRHASGMPPGQFRKQRDR